MHVNITKSETGDNKGSGARLVNYLEKENRLLQEKNPGAESEYWFNHQRQDIQPYEVRMGIDQNIAKLSKDEAKFFLVNISPSENEILFLKENYGKDGAWQAIKQYANKVMDAYAKNFRKDRVNGNQDLIYFGKVEKNRYYTWQDEEVKQGKAKRGEMKPGEQMHIQIIVSRKDTSNTIRLSPMNNSRGKNAKHSLIVGQFDRTAFKQSAEKQFDKSFDYPRELKETFEYANTLKHGTYEQVQEMKERRSEEKEMKQLLKEQMEEQKRQQEEKQQQSRSLGQSRGQRW